MRETLLPILAAIPPQPQRQDATDDQLRDLATFADRLGMYDASDCIRKLLDHRPRAAFPGES
jgi:hypothetical protein